MATASLNRLLHRLARRVGAEALAAQTDRQLIDRFLSRHDEAAFEALVRRHGPMVYRVCWHVLHQPQDAEDAVQATFLLLARKLGTVRKRESLASWLHGVARRVALKARAQASTRRRKEQSVARPADVPPEEVPWGDVRRVLDAELAQLPDRWRLPLVLCYLEGRTQEEAARQLAWSKKTLCRRLDKARAALGRRLRRRGVWPAALAAVLLSDSVAPAAPPPGLIDIIVTAAAPIVAGRLPSAVVSARVAALTHGVSTTMFPTRTRILAWTCSAILLTTLLALGALGTGHPLALQRALTREPSGPLTHQADSPRAGQGKVAPGRLVFYRAGHLTLISPDGKETKKVSSDRGKFHPGGHRLSPDGKRVAYLVFVNVGPGELPDRQPRRKAYVRGLDEPDPGTDLAVEAAELSWSPDGKQIVASELIEAEDSKSIKTVNWLVDVKTKARSALKLPANHQVVDWSRDGKHFLTVAYDIDHKPPTARLYLVNRDGSGAQALSDGRQPILSGRLSPDGRKVLHLAPDPTRQGKESQLRPGLWVLDIQQRKSSRVEQQALDGHIMGYCWSPDGKRIAYAWRQVHAKPDPKQETESHLIIADADGRNPVTIATERADEIATITIGRIDWR
jgi:RNA polymerase sigma factor (sigma-70 family)